MLPPDKQSEDFNIKLYKEKWKKKKEKKGWKSGNNLFAFMSL